jgi:inorganic pyrophosphatase
MQGPPGWTMERFWQTLDNLVAEAAVVIDRPKGTQHPRYPGFIYPLDYGYLQGTTSGDGGGIDAWVGSIAEKKATAVVVCVDLEKRDAEVKVLLCCTPEEAEMILAVHNDGSQSALLITR